MEITLIAAIGNNNELGINNTLPWHNPSDLRHFKEVTTGKSVIMGRNTYESFNGRVLPNRQMIVITTRNGYNAPGCIVVSSFAAALAACIYAPYIIGGAQIYKQTIDQADRLIISHMNKSVPDADCYFPEIDDTVWKVESSKTIPSFDYVIKTYTKRDKYCI